MQSETSGTTYLNFRNFHLLFVVHITVSNHKMVLTETSLEIKTNLTKLKILQGT